jgi:hypothetical protein
MRHPCAPAPAPAQAVSLPPLAQNAELIALRVRHDDPRLVTLTDVDTLGTMSLTASHLGGLVIRPEVEMQPAFDFLALGDPDEFQPLQGSGSGRISNSSSEEWTTAQPRASAHHCPRAAGTTE